MIFNEIKAAFKQTESIMSKNKSYYGLHKLKIGGEKHLIRGIVNRRGAIAIELYIKPGEYVEVTFSKNIKFRYHNYDNNIPIKSEEEFCKVFGWKESNLKELLNQINYYNALLI